MKKEQILKTIEFISKDMKLRNNRPHILFSWMPVIIEKSEFIHITEENKDKYINKILDYMKNSKEIEQIFVHIQKPYYLYVLFYIQDFLTEKEFADVLKFSWSAIEFPHQENNIVLIDLFEKVKDKKLLMNENELKIYNSLDKEVIIYRGLQGKKAKVKALSWTLSLEKAKWFANRWANKSDVYSAIINKEDIFMYENGRSEEEVVVNPIKLKNVKKI